MKQDQVINCGECHQEFTWTADEQQYYHDKQLDPPKFCLICRGKYAARARQLAQYQRKSGR